MRRTLWLWAPLLWACGVTASVPEEDMASPDMARPARVMDWAWVQGKSAVPARIDAEGEVELWLENTGSGTWEKGRAGLGAGPGNALSVQPDGEGCEAPCVVGLPGDVRPGQQVVVRFRVAGEEAGVRALELVMFEEGRAFGVPARWEIEVCLGGVCEAPDMAIEDMARVDMTPDMAEDMPVEDMMREPAPVYCRVDAQAGLNLRECPQGVMPGTQACPTILESMEHRAFVASLEESPSGWRQVRSLATGQEGWASGDFLECPVMLPEGLCPPETTTEERVMMCGSALLTATTRPLDAADPLYYVNRWYSVDKCYPWAPANEAGLLEYLEPALRARCGVYASDLVEVPAAYASGSRELRQVAWDAPAPQGPVQTYDGREVGYAGRVGFKAMFDAARAERGFEYVVISGFRSAETQRSLFLGYAEREGSVDRASVFSAKPTHSEHQLGTTADVTFIDGGQRFNAYGAPYAFTTRPEGRWLVENGHRFGIVTTYEAHKVESHQYQAEPWHLRFVGVEAADVMRACDLNTEELLAARYQIPALPAFGAMELVYERMQARGYPLCRR